MSLANRLHDRPNLDQQFGALALYISGSLPKAVVAEAYEGRLQIHNAIGACSVEVIDGVLPPAGSVYVDNTTGEVVVVWPKYSQGHADLDNPGFESGDWAGWTIETVGGTATPVIDNQYHYSGDHSLRWPETTGLGLAGRVELLAVNDTVGIAIPGQYINASLRMMYNPTHAHIDHGTIQFRGQAVLRWLRKDGSVIGHSYGPMEKGNKESYGVWMHIPVSARAPAGAAGVQLIAHTASRAVDSYVDGAAWDALTTAVGTNVEQMINLRIRVHDAGGRVADNLQEIAVSTGSYYFYTWSGSGSFALSAGASLDVLCVGGGGSGAAYGGGGGGGGGAVDVHRVFAAGTYSVVVGGGGQALVTYGNGYAGGSSSVGDILLSTGGEGGVAKGGGGPGGASGIGSLDGSVVRGPFAGDAMGIGGGGGAATAATNDNKGGNGLYVIWLDQYFGGGGGAGDAAYREGGLGGGGMGFYDDNALMDAENGTGGGGGGRWLSAGSHGGGGAGVVVVKARQPLIATGAYTVIEVVVG